jgi:hypothetical protein
MSKVTEGQAEMVKAASYRDAAKERRERLQRGEDVPGGLGEPLTREDAIRMMQEIHAAGHRAMTRAERAVWIRFPARWPQPERLMLGLLGGLANAIVGHRSG